MSRYWHCPNEGKFELLEGLSKKGLPWHWHQSGGLGWWWWDVTWQWQGSLVLIKPKFKVVITVIISLIVWGRFLHVTIAVTSCHWLAYQSVLPHGVWAHGKNVKAASVYKAQVVVHSTQVIIYCSLILAFFPTPQVRGKAALPLQGLGQMNAFQAHNFGWLSWHNQLKEVDVPFETLVVLLAALSSCWPDHSSCTSWTSVPKRFMEEAMSQKVEDRSWEPSSSKLVWWVLK